jgi:hypothetical protein
MEQDTGYWAPTQLDYLQAQFPDWTITRAVSGLYYANRPADSGVEPSGLLMGEDADDMGDVIRGWIGRHDHDPA